MTSEWKELEAEEAKIKQLQEEGHSYHCACRIVWGDGACECQREESYEKRKV